MFELHVLVPVRDNDGAVFSAEHHVCFERRATDAFGGLTRYGSTEGLWKDASGREFRDKMRRYGVAVTSITDGNKISALVEFAKSHYRQHAIFFSYLGQVEIL